jgi:hypothetical protein
MTNSTKIVYEHLRDYPTSTEGYKEIKAPAVAAAVYGEHMSGSKSQNTASVDGKSARPD